MIAWTPNSRYGGHAFGISSFAQFLAGREKILPWLAEYSPYALASADDPPVYPTYGAPPALGQDQKDPTHTSNFGVKLQEHCNAISIACELVYPGAPGVTHATTTDYLITGLKAPRQGKQRVSARPLSYSPRGRGIIWIHPNHEFPPLRSTRLRYCRQVRSR